MKSETFQKCLNELLNNITDKDRNDHKMSIARALLGAIRYINDEMY